MHLRIVPEHPTRLSMPSARPRSSLVSRDFLLAWWRILNGHVPMMSIEITRECPLSCPGCYAYGDSHLGGETTLRELSDFRGDALVNGVLDLVRRHKPLHVSLVGGEPMVRHRELSHLLPALSEIGIFTLLVTSGIIGIPAEWMTIPRLRVAVSIDGLPEHHNERRKPATYDRILKNIAGRSVNVHWVITRPMMVRPSYLEQYVEFWSALKEVDHIWVSLYSPQVGEESPERLTAADRERIGAELPVLAKKFPKLLLPEGVARAFVNPPKNPNDCLFSKMSLNYSADLQTHVEPCVFGGNPDCTQCGCSISSTLHWVRDLKVAGPLTVGHLVQGSLAVGSTMKKFRGDREAVNQWRGLRLSSQKPSLIQIESSRQGERV
jgi:MoaA/NifB/PqqE/SkfB family radical SAM enzyme